MPINVSKIRGCLPEKRFMGDFGALGECLPGEWVEF
jgi:hypothetical protein